MKIRRVVEAQIGPIHNPVIAHEATIAVGTDSPNPFEEMGLFDPVRKKCTNFSANSITVIENTNKTLKLHLIRRLGCTAVSPGRITSVRSPARSVLFSAF